MKKWVLLLLAVSSVYAQEGTPVKGLFGAGPPNANIAHVIGTQYIDTTTSLLYVCTAVTLTATVSSCTWTGAGGAAATTANSGFAGPLTIYPNAPPYNISFDGKVCYAPNVSWPNASTTVTCTSGTPTAAGSAAVSGNVATITFAASFPFNPILQGWLTGNTIVVSGYTAGDAFYNGTYTITGTSANTVTFALVHADAGSTTGGQINNSNIGPFLPIDTGKSGFGTNCETALTCFASPGGKVTRPLGAVTYVSATSITVAGNSNAVCNTNECQFWWFTDDRAKWCCSAGSVDAAIGTANSCVSIISPAGISPIPFGLGNNNSPNCGVVTSSLGQGNTSRQADAGNSFWGQAIGVTTFLLPPDVNWASCTGANGALGNGCLMTNMMGGGNFTITGGGNCQTGSNSKNIWAPSASASFFHDISLTNFACFDNAGNFLNIGALFGFSNKFNAIYVDAFGGNTCEITGLNVSLTESYCGESRFAPLVIAGTNTSARIEHTYIGATLATIGVWVGAGATGVKASIKNSQNYGSVGAGGTQIYVDAGAIVTLDNWYEHLSAPYDLQLSATGKAYIRDSQFTGSIHSIGTNGVTLTTGGLFDEGGNIDTGNNRESTVIPSCTFTSGGGTSPSCAVQTPGSTNEKGTIIATTGTGAPGSTGTITLTFAGIYAGAAGATPSCTVSPNDSGTAWGNEAVAKMSTQSTTAPVIAWSNDATAVLTALATSSPYRIDYICVAR